VPLFHARPIVRPDIALTPDLKVPSIGFGTYKCGEEVIRAALNGGYRYLDTASFYQNEEDVGRAIRSSGVPREQVFLATKAWKTELGFQSTQKAIDDSLRRLDTDYIDLYLIHWPRPDLETKNWRELDLESWRAMEQAHRDGKLRALGVSNFLPHHLYSLLELAEVKPVVNQIEFHPGYTQKAAVDFCQANGIQVQAWSPLGRRRLMGEPVLQDMAKRYSRSVPQICLRFALDCGVQPLPKSSDPARMAENRAVLDFTLSEGDLYELLSLPQLGWSGYHPDREQVVI
jgi:diketogulonate reductase-like aldo/keto reductase